MSFVPLCDPWEWGLKSYHPIITVLGRLRGRSGASLGCTVRPQLSLHQVDPGMVLSEAEHVPGTPQENDASGQDHPEANEHYHNLEHICPDHGLHTTLCRRGDAGHRPTQGRWAGLSGGKAEEGPQLTLPGFLWHRKLKPPSSPSPLGNSVLSQGRWVRGLDRVRGNGCDGPRHLRKQSNTQYCHYPLFVSGPCRLGWPRAYKLPASATPVLL